MAPLQGKAYVVHDHVKKGSKSRRKEHWARDQVGQGVLRAPIIQGAWSYAKGT